MRKPLCGQEFYTPPPPLSIAPDIILKIKKKINMVRNWTRKLQNPSPSSISLCPLRNLIEVLHAKCTLVGILSALHGTVGYKHMQMGDGLLRIYSNFLNLGWEDLNRLLKINQLYQHRHRRPYWTSSPPIDILYDKCFGDSVRWWIVLPDQCSKDAGKIAGFNIRLRCTIVAFRSRIMRVFRERSN